MPEHHLRRGQYAGKLPKRWGQHARNRGSASLERGVRMRWSIQQEFEKKPILANTIDNVEDPQQQNKNVNQLSIVDRGLATFHNYTINKAVTQVENETQVAEIHNINAKYERMFNYSKVLYILLTFERVYNIIYGSQLQLLQYINTYSNLSTEELIPFYETAKSKYPEFYETYTFESWLQFLINMDLIIRNDDGKYSITWIGRDFLKFIIELALSMSKRF